jgi:uncharacterized protein (DUF1330 family)/ketosteroid isomerase-like protein
MSNNVEVIGELFRAVQARDLQALLACYDEDVEIHEDSSLPYGGIYCGHDGAVRHAGAFLETWGPFQSDSEQLLDPTFLEGVDETVSVLFRHRAVDLGRGEHLDAAEVGVYNLRAGKIIRSQMFHEHTAELLRFLSDSGQTEAQVPTPMLLVAELTVTDPEAMLRYASEVQPVMARYGGRIAGVSATGPEVLEGDWHPQLIVVHHWRSRADFQAFWTSEEYKPLRHLRHTACESRIVVFDGVLPPSPQV